MVEIPDSDTGEETVFMNKRGIQRRMQCNGRTANRIRDTFVTANQLVDAITDEQDLSDRDGIGPKTAEAVRNWWENRHRREEKVNGAEFESTGKRTGTIYNLGDWSPVLDESESAPNQEDT